MVDLTAGTQRADRAENAQERDRPMMRAELQRTASKTTVRINAAVDVKIQPFGVELAKAQACLEQLDEDRPVEGVALVESFRLLDSNFAEMIMRINDSS